MLVNGKNLKEYVSGHGFDSAKIVRQYLRWFDCCPALREALDELYEEHLEAQRILAERRRFSPEGEAERVKRLHEEAKGVKAKHKTGVSEKKKSKVTYAEPRVPETVIDFCPRCGSVVRGEPVPGCEKEASGRAFYAECSACTYYYEIFEKGKRHRKVEGG